MFPVWLAGWLGSVEPVPGSPSLVVARIWPLGSVTMSSATTSLTLPLRAWISPNDVSGVPQDVWVTFSTTFVTPVCSRYRSCPSTPVSVVVRRTLPFRARASSTFIGPVVSVMNTLLSACAARSQVADTARSPAVASV